MPLRTVRNDADGADVTHIVFCAVIARALHPWPSPLCALRSVLDLLDVASSASRTRWNALTH